MSIFIRLSFSSRTPVYFNISTIIAVAPTSDYQRRINRARSEIFHTGGDSFEVIESPERVMALIEQATSVGEEVSAEILTMKAGGRP